MIGLAGGGLGIVLARMLVESVAVPLWLAGLFALLGLILGVLRDRALRRRPPG